MLFTNATGPVGVARGRNGDVKNRTATQWHSGLKAKLCTSSGASFIRTSLPLSNTNVNNFEFVLLTYKDGHR